jgi:hypothetical protein
VATKCTGDWTVAPLLGEVTKTPADADATRIATERHTFTLFIKKLHLELETEVAFQFSGCELGWSVGD